MSLKFYLLLQKQLKRKKHNKLIIKPQITQINNNKSSKGSKFRSTEIKFVKIWVICGKSYLTKRLESAGFFMISSDNIPDYD